MPSEAIARWIEVAKHNRRRYDNVLVVIDGLVADRYNGIELEVYPLASGRDGFGARARDGVGRGYCATAPTRVDACERALNGYLDIRNNGI